MDKVYEWLLEGEPWVAYGTRIDLLGEPAESPACRKLKKEIEGHPLVSSIFDEIGNWPGTVLSSHKSANQTYHKLSFLADIGLDKRVTAIAETIPKIMEHTSEEGLFELKLVIPEHFGGSGEEEWAWALCDAPVIMDSLVRFGLGKDKRVQRGAKYLASLVRENGWPCTVSKKLGNFRGPGKKADPCPYATLIMVKLLADIDPAAYDKEIATGAHCLLDLWEKSKEEHPYMFFMGTDFRKLKAPFIWYDILHVLDVLTRIHAIRKDKRLVSMYKTLESKADKDGKFTPESVYQTWKALDFGQKKVPSKWLTLSALRIMNRMKK